MTLVLKWYIYYKMFTGNDGKRPSEDQNHARVGNVAGFGLFLIKLFFFPKACSIFFVNVMIWIVGLKFDFANKIKKFVLCSRLLYLWIILGN